MPGGKTKGTKRKSSTKIGHPSRAKKINSSNNITTDVVVDKMNSSLDSSVNSQSREECYHCHNTIDTMPSSDQPLSYVICDKCGVLAHVFCLGYASTFEGALKDLINLLGWQCFDCKTSNRNRLLDLEKECRSLKTELNKLKTAHRSIQKDMAALKVALSTVPQQKPLERNQPVEVSDIPPGAASLINNRIDSSNAGSYAQVVALPPSPVSMDVILKSVHLEIMNKTKKKANIVISGLAPSKECDDKVMVSRLLSNHWSIPDDSVVGCKRLGQVKVNRIQLILVTLRNKSIV